VICPQCGHHNIFGDDHVVVETESQPPVTSEVVVDPTSDQLQQESDVIAPNEILDDQGSQQSSINIEEGLSSGEPFQDVDSYLNEDHQNLDSNMGLALEEIVEFGNSNQSITSQIVYNIVISEINLGEEKAIVMSAIQKNHIDLAQVDIRLNKGEIEIKQIGAARVARIIRELGGHDVRYHVYQVPL
jgi:hypothetical protein